MSVDRELYRTVDFILNRASSSDLEVLKKAMDRRERDSRHKLSAANIRGTARDLAGGMSDQLASIGDIKEMTRRYVREMVRKALPSIPEEHIELMLEEWLPQRDRRVSEDNLPPDVVRSMIVQFVDYSVGRMSERDKAELKGDWSRRYWSAFSERTRSLVRELLMGAITEPQFWAKVDEPEP